jgi:hypothetical protein
MGAAWRDAAEGERAADRVLDMVRGVRALGMEACARWHADAGAGRRAGRCRLSAYNHNLDTSPEFYGSIITTRDYTGTPDTIARVRRAGVTVCCGGIIGMGETRRARWGLLQQLSSLDPHPESVPVNMLARVEGTPLGDRPAEDPLELVRTIATARILMPLAFVRLSAGRMSLTPEAQALCFLAGANSVFLGDQLLTTPNPSADVDRRLFADLGLQLQETPRAGCLSRSNRASRTACAPFETDSCSGRLSPADRLPRTTISASQTTLAPEARHDPGHRPGRRRQHGRDCCAATATRCGCRAQVRRVQADRVSLFSSVPANSPCCDTPERGDGSTNERNHASLIDGPAVGGRPRRVSAQRSEGLRSHGDRPPRSGVRGDGIALQHGWRRAAARGVRRAVPGHRRRAHR